MVKEVLQLGFGGEFSLTLEAKTRTNSSVPVPEASIVKSRFVPKEQLVFDEEKIRKEISSLRLVGKGKDVYVPTVDGARRHKAKLEEYAVLRMIKPSNRQHRPFYINRFPIKLTKYGHTWVMPAGTPVYTYSKQTKIPEKMIPQIIQRLRQAANKA